MSGNLARRRMVKFMPAEFKLTETRQPPLKDMYDEWLARVICYAFSVPASAFVTQINQATSETLRAQAAHKGLVPLKLAHDLRDRAAPSGRPPTISGLIVAPSTTSSESSAPDGCHLTSKVCWSARLSQIAQLSDWIPT
jgi:hypothetical protein